MSNVSGGIGYCILQNSITNKTILMIYDDHNGTKYCSSGGYVQDYFNNLPQEKWISLVEDISLKRKSLDELKIYPMFGNKKHIQNTFKWKEKENVFKVDLRYEENPPWKKSNIKTYDNLLSDAIEYKNKIPLSANNLNINEYHYLKNWKQSFQNIDMEERNFIIDSWKLDGHVLGLINENTDKNILVYMGADHIDSIKSWLPKLNYIGCYNSTFIMPKKNYWEHMESCIKLPKEGDFIKQANKKCEIVMNYAKKYQKYKVKYISLKNNYLNSKKK